MGNPIQQAVAFYRVVLRTWAEIWSQDPKAVEMLVALQAMVWGLWFFLFDPFEAAPHVYEFMAVAPEWVWGTLCVGGGLLMWLALHQGGRVPRAVTALGGTVFWVFVTAGFLAGDAQVTGAPIYGMTAAAHGWVFFWHVFQHGRKSAELTVVRTLEILDRISA